MPEEKVVKEKPAKIKGLIREIVSPKKLADYFAKPKNHSLSVKAVNKCLTAMRDYCRKIAESKIGGREQIAAPVVIFAPSAVKFGVSPFRAKVGKDGKIRYSNYCVTAFYFLQKTLLRYSCDYSLIYNIIEDETAEEIFHSDIISMGVYNDTAMIDEKGTPKPNKIQLFRIGTASHHSETVLRNLTAEAQCGFAPDTGYDGKVNRIKQIIESRKYETYKNDCKIPFDGPEDNDIPDETDI